MTLTLLAIAWFGGLCLSRFGLDSYPLALGAGFLLGLVAFPRVGPWVSLAAAALLLAGFAAYENAGRPLAATPATAYEGNFQLEVDTEPRLVATRRSFEGTFNSLGSDEWDGRRVAVETPAFLDVGYGDILRGSGEAVPLDVQADEDRHLREQGLAGRVVYPEVETVSPGHGSWWRERLLTVRGFFSDRLDEALPEPASSLARGMLLGERSSIDPELRDDLNSAGTSHLIAISGQNIALLAAAVSVLTAPLLGRRRAAFAAVSAVVLYTLLLGAPPSVLRAALMGTVLVMAPVFGRQPHGLAALSLAAVAMTAVDPGVVSELSFQLSLAATAGLIILGEPLAATFGRLARSLTGNPLPVVTGMLAVTVAATLATWPIIAINFGTVSLAALGSNFLVIPTFIPTLVAALVAIAASFLPSPLAETGAWPAWVLLEYFAFVARLFGGGALNIEVADFHSEQATLVYLVLLALAFLLNTRPAHDRDAAGELRAGPALVVPVLLVANAVLWVGFASADGSRELRVSFLDVGQGDATLIETPNGRRIVIDGGPDPERVIRELDAELGFGDNRIDLLLLTHVAADHATGAIAVLQRYDVRRVGWTGLSDDSDLSRQWLEELDESESEIVELEPGNRLEIDGVTLDILAPRHAEAAEEENDASLVVRLAYGSTEVMFTGDLEAAGEVELLTSLQPLDAELLKVGHHGSETSSLPEFLAAVAPTFALIPVGFSNPFGHPSPLVLERLLALDIEVYRTDEDGRVTFISDGERIWLD